MMLRIFILLFILSLSISLKAQDTAYAHNIVDTLTSPYFWGRGYTNEGVQKAASFLKDEFRNIGLTPLDGHSYLQPYSFPVNTFPDKLRVQVNQKVLIPGLDYIVAPESRSFKAKGKLRQVDSATYIDSENRLMLVMKKKLTWSVSHKQADYTEFEILKNTVKEPLKSYDVHIDANMVEDFPCMNVCGYVAGKDVPDSFIFFSAHYDHLGGMGSETYFPGANDNASGVALLLNLAKYFRAHPSRYSIGFILFSGEEIGLEGSKHYVKNPIIPLNKMRFLLNTDLAGTGEEGITVVNATEYPNEFKRMQEINQDKHYLKAVVARGKAANSDHYFFSENGVPSFFFYTMGGIGAYHDVYDKAETLPLNEHMDLFHLMVDFVGDLTKQK